MGHFGSGWHAIPPIWLPSMGSRTEQWPVALHHKGAGIIWQAHWPLEGRQFSNQCAKMS